MIVSDQLTYPGRTDLRASNRQLRPRRSIPSEIGITQKHARRLSLHTFDVCFDIRRLVVVMTTLKVPNTGHVGACRPQAALHDGRLSCWCDQRVRANKSKHRPRFHLGPPVWTVFRWFTPPVTMNDVGSL